MQFKHLIRSLAILVLGLFATASYAAGQATGVSAPSSAVQGGLVRITVIGKGTCGSRIRFGDGRSSNISSQVFPHKYTHRYTRTGTMTINAKVTGAGCSSRAPLTARIRITARTIKLPGVGKPPIRKIPSVKPIRPEFRIRPAAELRLALRRPASITPATPFAPDTRFTAHVTVQNTGGTRAYVRVVQIGRTSSGGVGVTASSRAFWVNTGQTVQARVGGLQAIRGKIIGDRYRTTLRLFNASPGRKGMPARAWRDRYAANNTININVPIRAMQYTVFVKLNNITFNGNCRPVGHRVSHTVQITAEARYYDTRPSGPLFARSAQSANFPSSGRYAARLTPGTNIRINKTFRFDHIYKGHPFRMSVAMTRYDKRDWLPIVRGSLGTAVTEVRPLVWLYGGSMTNHSAGGVTRSRFVCRNNGAFSTHWQVWSRPER